MDSFNSRQLPTGKRLGICVLLSFFILLFSKGAPCSEITPEDTSSDEPVELHITSESLLSDRNSNFAEFTGHVVATQEGSVLTCDRLKITYSAKDESADKDEKKDDESPSGAIETIVAFGRVVMTMEDKKAWADKAVFNRADDTVILTGGPPKVLSGKSTITGKTIILNRKTGKISVDGAVSATLFQEDTKNLKKDPKTP